MEELRRADADERAERERALAEVRSQIKRVAADGLDFERAGVFWVIAGTLFSTFPVEIAGWVARWWP